jgi:hypothetical protein
MNVRDDTEIDWKTLPDSDWNLWSAHSLQRRWLTMKRGIKGYEDMTHQGLFFKDHQVIINYELSYLQKLWISSESRKLTFLPLQRHVNEKSPVRQTSMSRRNQNLETRGQVVYKRVHLMARIEMPMGQPTIRMLDVIAIVMNTNIQLLLP